LPSWWSFDVWSRGVGARAHPVHPALDERAVLEVLLEDLAVGVVDALVEQDGTVRIEQCRVAVIVVGELGSPRVAGRAQLDRFAVADARRPHDQARAVERRPARRWRLRPGHVA
jgi:hypothetical protein